MRDWFKVSMFCQKTFQAGSQSIWFYNLSEYVVINNNVCVFKFGARVDAPAPRAVRARDRWSAPAPLPGCARDSTLRFHHYSWHDFPLYTYFLCTWSPYYLFHTIKFKIKILIRVQIKPCSAKLIFVWSLLCWSVGYYVRHYCYITT